jgi:DNA mismatch repair protein MLH3
MSIQPLPPVVIAQIKSSITITSLNCVVTELLKNSLDAGSKKIDINVDYGRGGCVVEDDGLGIFPAEFGESGGLGKLYREKSTFGRGGDETDI